MHGAYTDARFCSCPMVQVCSGWPSNGAWACCHMAQLGGCQAVRCARPVRARWRRTVDPTNEDLFGDEVQRHSIAVLGACPGAISASSTISAYIQQKETYHMHMPHLMCVSMPAHSSGTCACMSTIVKLADSSFRCGDTLLVNARTEVSYRQAPVAERTS